MDFGHLPPFVFENIQTKGKNKFFNMFGIWSPPHPSLEKVQTQAEKFQFQLHPKFPSTNNNKKFLNKFGLEHDPTNPSLNFFQKIRKCFRRCLPLVPQGKDWSAINLLAGHPTLTSMFQTAPHCCTALHHAAPHWIILSQNEPHWNVVHHAVPSSTTLHHAEPHWITLYIRVSKSHGLTVVQTR